MACCASCATKRPGLGDAALQSQIAQLSTATVGAVGGAFTPVIASSIFASAVTGTAPLWAIPVVGAAIAGITIALGAILGRKGPRQKELATQDVNKVSDLMTQNLQAYMAGNRDRPAQLMALENFDQAWAWLISTAGCGNPDLGDAGKRCISERQRGGTAPWCPTGTGCDYFTALRDPIANDTRPGELEAAANTSSLGLPSLPSISLPVVGSLSPWLLIGAALLAWGAFSE